MKYQIIYADPSWDYGSRGPRSGKFGELDYPPMKTADILAMPVDLIAAPDCALFLWVTSAFNDIGIDVIRSWGFRYVRWDSVWLKRHPSGKPQATCGPWGMTDCEVLLMGVRGNMCSKQIGKRNWLTGVEESRTDTHSEKPNIFRKRIDERFGDLDKIELFARKPAVGWRAVGNEIDGKDVSLAIREIADE